jgi:hypothetical protein
MNSSERADCRHVNYRLYLRLIRDCRCFDGIFPSSRRRELDSASRTLWKAITTDDKWFQPQRLTGSSEVDFVLFELLYRLGGAGLTLPDAWNALVPLLKREVFDIRCTEGRVHLRTSVAMLEQVRPEMDPDATEVWKPMKYAIDKALRLGISLCMPMVSKACDKGDIDSRPSRIGRTKREVEIGSFVRWLYRRDFGDDRIRGDDFRN